MQNFMRKRLALYTCYIATAMLVLIFSGLANASSAAAQSDTLERHVTASPEALSRFAASHSLHDL